MAATEFYTSLENLGLQQYHDVLVAEAFNSWPVLSQITEQDMTDLGIKLGHRRLLQTAISRFGEVNRASSATKVSQAAAAAHAESEARNAAVLTIIDDIDSNGRMNQRQKRKYVRHPKADENAPARPPTGYVMFSNWVRENVKDQHFDFPDIAKLVGKRWQALPKHEKDWWLAKAKDRKVTYTQDLINYKRTVKYRNYQRYLLDFKIRNGTLPPARSRNNSGSSGLGYSDDESGEAMDQGNESASEPSEFSGDLPPFRSLDGPPPGLRSPLSASSPSTLEPAIVGLARGLLSSATGVPVQGPMMRSPPAEYNRLPAMANVTHRQLPPLPVPSFRH